MYNGIGLQTARGSGTSGYVQKNISYNVKKIETKQQFLKRMQDARTNNLPPPRKANPEIVEHERKRQIMIQKMKLKAKLEEEGLAEEEIVQRLEKAEKILKDKLEKGQIQTKNRDTHIMTQAKQRQYTKLTQVFGLKQGEKPGSAFDFQGQKEQRLKHLEEKRKKFTFVCTHEGCQKVYDSQHRLQRHLKYKHPEQLKQLAGQKKQPQPQKQKTKQEKQTK